MVIRWAEVSPEFGSALPHGSCNAISDVDGLTVCGYPRRADGTCLNGHPAAPITAEQLTDGATP